MKILVINPGSTSTKVSVFKNRKELFTESVFHDAPLMLSFKTTNDQLPYRKQVTLDILKQHSISIQDIDIFIGRGGSAHTQTGGLTTIDSTLYTDTKNEVSKTDHAAKLGVMIAYQFSQENNKVAFTINPTNMDELQDVARITGIKGLYRRPQSHALNQKAIAQLQAQKLEKKAENCNFVIAHIDGGITIGAHQNGKMIDCTEGAGGDGPFTPTRIGSIPVLEVVRYIENGHKTDEIRALCSHSGGFISYFGTSDTKKIYEKIQSKDPEATLIWHAILYQISKCIGEMAAVLKGNVDNIILTGGLVRYQEVIDYITEHCGFIAPIVTYPGEVEQQAMAWAVCDYLEGKIQPKTYIPHDVFEGFPWDSQVY